MCVCGRLCASVPVCECASVLVCMYVCVRVHLCACVRVCMRMCVCVCLCACVRGCKCACMCEGKTYAPPTTRCWMQPLNHLDKFCNLVGRRDFSPEGNPPIKIEAGDQLENLPSNRETDFMCSSSTCTNRDLTDEKVICQ